MKRHDTNLNLLAALDALLTEQHVGRAATRAGVTQSAMSHSLRQLRDILDDPVLIRSGHTMVPTPRAMELAPRLQEGLRLLEGVLQGPEAFDPASATRSFTVASLDAPAALILREVVPRIRAAAPRAQLQIVGPGPKLAEQLLRGDVDVALLPPFAEIAGTRSRRLPGVGTSVVGRADHPALAAPLDLDAYCSLPHAMATYSGVGGSMIDELLKRHGRERRVVLKTPFGLALSEALANSDLIATVPDPLAEHFVAHWPVRAVPAPFVLPPSDLLVSWHERYDADPANRWFRDMLFDAFIATDAQLAPPGRHGR